MKYRYFLLVLVWKAALVADVIDENKRKVGTEIALFDKELAPFIERVLHNQQLPSVAVAVVHKNEILYAAGFGYANKKQGIKADAQTVYGVGSVSKVVTAVGVMQLVEQGKINLSDPVTDYIPLHVKAPYGVPKDKQIAPITVLNLLTHTAGLPLTVPEADQDDLSKPETLNSILQKINTRVFLDYLPNVQYAYSNLGITIAGSIMEKVSGQEFNAYMQKDVFDVLNMSTASFSNTGLPPLIQERLAQPYNAKGPTSRPPIRGYPAGNLYASAIDMSNFMRMMLSNGMFEGHRVLQEKTIEQMFTEQMPELRNKTGIGPNQGIVWMVSNPGIPNATKVAWHNGLRVGYTTLLYLLPEEGIGVVVMTNIRKKVGSSQEFMPKGIAQQAIKVAREALAKRTLNNKTLQKADL